MNIYIYIYIYYTYTYIIEFCQQGFIYSEEAQCIHHMYHVAKCLSCHKVISVITRSAHCFHDYICVVPILYLQDVSTCFVDIYHIIRVTCLIPKEMFCLGQTMNIKHKVKWILKFVKILNLFSFLPRSEKSSGKRLGYI